MMHGNHQIKPDNILNILWLGMLCSPVFTWIWILVMDKLSLVQRIEIEYSEYLFYAGLVLIIPALLALKHFRNVRSSFQGMDTASLFADNQARQKLLQSLIIGMGLADTPAVLSLGYYYLQGDMEKSILLVGISFLLCYLFKPSAR